MENQELVLQRLELRQERPVGTLLVRAFADDPLVKTICDSDPSRRARQTSWSFRISVRSHCLARQPGWVAYGTGEHPAAVILVSRPGMVLNGPSDLGFMVQALPRLGWRTIRRGLQAGALLFKHAPPGAFTYVRTLAVAPEMQRQGLGSQLLRHVLQSSPPHWPVYLETAKESNVRFYERHGMQCLGDFDCLGVTVWRLLRPVKRAQETRFAP